MNRRIGPAFLLEDIHETFQLSKSLKKDYLTATPEERAKLSKLMSRTVRITKDQDLRPGDHAIRG
jgi:hypothetical protein